MLGALKQKVSSFTLVPSDGGRFELEVDGQLVYSKLATGAFPNEAQLLADVRGRS